MKLLYICIALATLTNVNGQTSDDWLDESFVKLDKVGCDVLGLIYCCEIYANVYHKAIQNGLVTRALNLKQEAEDQGLSFDELVKKANKQIEADIDSLGFGIVTNSLGYKDLFNMIAEGNMTKEEISNAMLDKIQNSGLKRRNINKLIVERCPNWRYKMDHSGMGMAISEDRNGDFVDKSVAVDGENGKPQIDCDALDFFYCCLTSNTVGRYNKSVYTYNYLQLKQRAEKAGLSMKDVLTKAWKSFSNDHTYGQDLQWVLQKWTVDAQYTDQQIAKKLQTIVHGRGIPWQDQAELERLLKEKCFKNLQNY